MCLLRLVVRTSGFHPDNSSSILLGDGKLHICVCSFFYFKHSRVCKPAAFSSIIVPFLFRADQRFFAVFALFE